MHIHLKLKIHQRIVHAKKKGFLSSRGSGAAAFPGEAGEYVVWAQRLEWPPRYGRTSTPRHQVVDLRPLLI